MLTMFYLLSVAAEVRKKCFNITVKKFFRKMILFKAPNISDISPFLNKPVPYRGQRNEPKYTNLVVDKAAEILHTDAEKLKEISTKNAFELFKKLK